MNLLVPIIIWCADAPFRLDWMPLSLSDHLNNLRAAALALKAIGPSGFEGLMAAVLAEVIGVPFRLAGGGSQFGFDGKTAHINEAIGFECKRYSNDISRTEVMSKIADITIQKNPSTDLWLLCATTAVSSQLTDDARTLASQHGVAISILDWTENGLPPLAAALASGRIAAESHFKQNLEDKEIQRFAIEALGAIAKSADFAASSSAILQELNAVSIGMRLALDANAKWHRAAFSNSKLARIRLGQPLCPLEKRNEELAVRTAPSGKIRSYLVGKPDGSIAAVLGEEGAGKSWSVAMSWLELANPPILLFFAADEFAVWSRSNDNETLLIEKLIEQTGERRTETVIMRWRRRIALWHANTIPSRSRVVVLIDGLNQRPNVDWGALLDGIASMLDEIGGRLVVTSRTAFFEHQIKNRLVSEITEIAIPLLSEGERDTILQGCGIHYSDIKKPVAESLRNPRLLSVALSLLLTAKITLPDELSVSRLLFEYMRVAERDNAIPRTAREFANDLQYRAREVLNRLQNRQMDDLAVFNRDLLAVAEGRFFFPIPGAPLLYRLKDEGLKLAFALAIIDELKRAERNGKALSEVLEVFIEPIGQLDQTAAVVLSAVTVASFSEDCSDEIVSALVSAFSQVQNPNADDFSAFSAAVKRRIEAALISARAQCLSGGRQPNFDWIQEAIEDARGSPDAWIVIAKHLKAWLATYSLAPEPLDSSANQTELSEEDKANRGKVRAEIASRLSALSAPEKTLLASMSQCIEGDPSILADLAFKLMAGRPLTDFGYSFVQWCLSSTLHSDRSLALGDFQFLIRFNMTDWAETREAVLRHSAPLHSPATSSTGQWALVNLLRATGDPEDARQAMALSTKLTADRPRSEGWRLVEQYCASDPCDPSSTVPENITATSIKYSNIDASKLRYSLSMSDEDHFFEMARLGVARFSSKVAVQKHREWIAQILERDEQSLRYGLFGAEPHAALLTRELALQSIETLRIRKLDALDAHEKDSNRWVVSQFLLLLAFPALSAKEQIKALLSQAPKDGFLLELMDLAKSLDKSELEKLLDNAVREHDFEAQVTILAFGRASASPLSLRVHTLLADLTRSTSTRVRAQSFAWIAAIEEPALLRSVVDSGWQATNETVEHELEAWYGSFAVLKAAKAGLLSAAATLDRISPKLYGRAALILGPEAARQVAFRVDEAIRRALNFDPDDCGLQLAISVDVASEIEPDRIHASMPRDDLNDPGTLFKEITETEEAFERRQERIRASFDRFKAQLTQEGATILLDNMSIAEFAAIAAADMSLANEWYSILIKSPKHQRDRASNFAVLLAHFLAEWNADRAVTLFSAYHATRPFMRLAYGFAATSLATSALWSAKEGIQLDEFRFKALDTAADDNLLVEHVCAALKHGKSDLLHRYVESRISSGHPAQISRALMVAGLSDDDAFARQVLSRYKDTPGFIGQSCAAALYSFQRNAWARQWFERLCGATTAEEFWQYSVIFAKVVDGRLDVWGQHYTERQAPFRLYWHSVVKSIKRRCEKLRNARDGKLFGNSAPGRFATPNP